jgi:hypothetical protein
LFSQGELQALVDAVQLLPKELAERRPWLSITPGLGEWRLPANGNEVERLHALARVTPIRSSSPPEENDDARWLMQTEMIATGAISALMSGHLGKVLRWRIS